MPPLEPYSRQLPYSYALGLYPATQALLHAPERVSRVLVHSKLEDGEGSKALLNLCLQHKIRVEQADKLLKRLSGKENCFAAAVFHKAKQTLSPLSKHLVLVNPMDLGNLGTILRTALGLGFQEVALIRPCADPDEPQAVRASMGAVFGLKIAEFESFEAYMQTLGRRQIYPFMLTKKALPLGQVVPEKDEVFSLVFGNEGSGLPRFFEDLGQPVMIEQNDSVDSLNLAVAAAIGMYTFSKF